MEQRIKMMISTMKVRMTTRKTMMKVSKMSMSERPARSAKNERENSYH